MPRFALRLKLAATLPFALALTAHAQSPAPAARPDVPAVSRVVLLLHTDLASKGSKVGQAVKANSEQAITLSNGVKLPRGTAFVGSVVAVSRHSKDKPNGAISVEFHQALPKGESPVPLLVKMLILAPPSVDNTAAIPNSNGNMVSLASNSGGDAQFMYQMNDRTDDRAKNPDSSTIPGVYLSPSATSSGIIFALGDEVYLDHDARITIILAPAPAAK